MQVETNSMNSVPKRRRGFYFLGFLILLFVLSGAYLVMNPIVLQTSGRASQKSRVAMENSYIFASPLSSCANGASQIRITVFALDGDGLGVEGVPVSVVLPTQFKSQSTGSDTDMYGKVYFDITSTTEGKDRVGALIEGRKLPADVEVDFRNSSDCD